MTPCLKFCTSSEFNHEQLLCVVNKRTDRKKESKNKEEEAENNDSKTKYYICTPYGYVCVGNRFHAEYHQIYIYKQQTHNMYIYIRINELFSGLTSWCCCKRLPFVVKSTLYGMVCKSVMCLVRERTRARTSADTKTHMLETKHHAKDSERE